MVRRLSRHRPFLCAGFKGKDQKVGRGQLTATCIKCVRHQIEFTTDPFMPLIPQPRCVSRLSPYDLNGGACIRARFRGSPLLLKAGHLVTW